MYARPRSVEEALSLLAAKRSVVMCGGTDIFPAAVGRPMPENVVDLSAIPGLRTIEETSEGYMIGGTVTWSIIASAPLPAAFDGLKMAAREVGSVQIQNRATIAGNLCNASPAADGVPPLLTLDAAVVLRSPRGTRRIPLPDFITGYRQTCLAADEILSAVFVPQPPPKARSAFVKLGARRYLVISIVMAAALVERDANGQIINAAIAVGAASPVAARVPLLEKALAEMPPGTRPSSIVAREHLASLTPIDDVRAPAEYRMDAARILVGEALDQAAGVWPVA